MLRQYHLTILVVEIFVASPVFKNIVSTTTQDIGTVKVFSRPLGNLLISRHLLTVGNLYSFKDFWIFSFEFIQEDSTILALIVCTIRFSIGNVKIFLDFCAFTVGSIVVDTSCRYHFFTWQVVDLVWHPVRNGLDIDTVESTESIEQVI